MASPNLRYLALRQRLTGMLSEEGASQLSLAVLVRELYRGLPHYRVLGIFRVEGDQLELAAGHGSAAETVASMGDGLARVAAETRATIFVSDISRDERARPVDEEIAGELTVPILHSGTVVGVIDVQSDRHGALGFGDRELLQWLAEQLGPRLQGGVSRQ
jgi:L-methionine (R)-S-oxide reductase